MPGLHNRLGLGLPRVSVAARRCAFDKGLGVGPTAAAIHGEMLPGDYRSRFDEVRRGKHGTVRARGHGI